MKGALRRTVLPRSVRTKKKNSRTATQGGDSRDLRRTAYATAINHVRKSRNQCTDPDAAHSRDDRSRDDSAHRDADTPKEIGITLIDTVCDQHHSQP